MNLIYCNRVIKEKFPMFDVVAATQLATGQVRCEGISERDFHSVMVKQGKSTAYCRFADLKPKSKVQLFYDYDCKNKMGRMPVRSELLLPVSDKILVHRVIKKNFLIGIDNQVYMC